MNSIIKFFSGAILAFVVFINSIGNFLGIGDLIPTQPEVPSTTAVVEESTTFPDGPVINIPTEPETEQFPAEPDVTLPAENTTLPEETTTKKPEMPTTAPEVPEETTPVPTEPTVDIPYEPTTIPEETTTEKPSEPTTVPDEPTTTEVPETTKPVEDNAQRIVVDGKYVCFGWNADKITAVLGVTSDTVYEITTDGKQLLSLVYASDYSKLAVYQLVDNVFSGFYTVDTDAVITDGTDEYSIASSGATAQSKLKIKEYKDSYQNDMVYAVYVSYNGFSVKSKNLVVQNGQAALNYYVTNALRAINGIYAYDYCIKAEAAIALHCNDMATRDYFEHVSPEGEHVWDRLNAQGISYSACAENIAMGSSGNAFSFADAWYNSKSGHRDAVLSTEYDYTGIAFVVAADGTTYCGQNFYRPR